MINILRLSLIALIFTSIAPSARATEGLKESESGDVKRSAASSSKQYHDEHNTDAPTQKTATQVRSTYVLAAVKWAYSWIQSDDNAAPSRLAFLKTKKFLVPATIVTAIAAAYWSDPETLYNFGSEMLMPIIGSYLGVTSPHNTGSVSTGDVGDIVTLQHSAPLNSSH